MRERRAGAAAPGSLTIGRSTSGLHDVRNKHLLLATAAVIVGSVLLWSFALDFTDPAPGPVDVDQYFDPGAVPVPEGAERFQSIMDDIEPVLLPPPAQAPAVPSSIVSKRAGELWSPEQPQADMACLFVDPRDPAADTLLVAPVPNKCASITPDAAQQSQAAAWLRGGMLEVDTTFCSGAEYAIPRDGALSFQPVPGGAWSVDADYLFVRCQPQDQPIVLVQSRKKEEAKQRASAAAANLRSRSRGGSPDMNVVMIVARAVSRRQFFRLLPRTIAALRALDRAPHQEVAHFPWFHAVGQLPSHSLAALLSGDADRLQSDAAPAGLPWLWEHFKAMGYITSVGGTGCDPRLRKAAQSADDTVGFELSCDVLRHMFKLQAYKPDMEMPCVGGQALHELTLQHLLAFMAAYPEQPKMALHVLEEGTTGSPGRVAALDAALAGTVTALLQAHPRTVLVLASEGGERESNFFFNTQSGAREAMAPALFLSLPASLIDTAPAVARAVAENQRRLVTARDVYSTLLHVPRVREGAPPDLPRHSLSLLSILPDDRDCGSAALPPRQCLCGRWVETKRDVRGLVEHVLSRMNHQLWLPGERAHRCQPLRLSTIVSARALADTFAMHPVSLPQSTRFAVEFQTRGGTGFSGQTFYTEVLDLAWRFKRAKDGRVYSYHSFHAPIIRRRTSALAFKPCLGAGPDAPPLEYCVCDVGEKEGGAASVEEKVLGEVGSAHAGTYVEMVDKDDVLLSRWSHGSAEAFEVFNRKPVGIVFKVSLRNDNAYNMRVSRPSPLWTHVPSHTRRHVMVLERAEPGQGWMWNFDWRWDVSSPKQEPESPSFAVGGHFANAEIYHTCRSGVALTKMYNLAPAQGEPRSASFQVTNSRAHPIRYSLDVFVHKNSRVRAEGPSSVERQLLLPGEERLLVFVVALSQDAEKAREDLQGLGYTVAWVPA